MMWGLFISYNCLLKPDRKPVDKRDITFPNENETANLPGSPFIADMNDPVDKNYTALPIFNSKLLEYNLI